MDTLHELESFLSRQFEPATLDQEEEEWQELTIGSRAVQAHYTHVDEMADRLGKSEDEVRRAFVRSFKIDHPDLWRKMKTDWRGYSIHKLVVEAKEWLELTRNSGMPAVPKRATRIAAVMEDDGHGERCTSLPSVAAAVGPASPDVAEAQLKAMRTDLTDQVGGLSGMIKDLMGALTTMMPAMQSRSHVTGGPLAANLSVPPPVPSPPPRQQTSTVGLPTGWVKATIIKVGPREGYAKVALDPMTATGPNGNPLNAHVLNVSAPYEVRRQLKLDDKLEVKVARDEVGVRVTELRTAYRN
jgi:hypothetical protein